MEVKVFNSDFNGYINKANIKVEAVGVTLDEDYFGEKNYYEISIKFFERILGKIFNSFSGKNLYLIDKKTKDGHFNRIELYKGLWKDSAFKGEQVEKIFTSGNISYILGSSKVLFNEIKDLLKMWDSVICFASANVIENLFFQDTNLLKDFSTIKDYLLENQCLLVEHLDLSFDGNSLFFYEKTRSDKLELIKEICQSLKIEDL